jgi:hypothetical protein
MRNGCEAYNHIPVSEDFQFACPDRQPESAVTVEFEIDRTLNVWAGSPL